VIEMNMFWKILLVAQREDQGSMGCCYSLLPQYPCGRSHRPQPRSLQFCKGRGECLASLPLTHPRGSGASSNLQL
jgi:hypothetical protein